MTKEELKQNLGLETEEDILTEFASVAKELNSLLKDRNESEAAGADPELTEALEDRAYILVTELSELAELLPERLEELKDLIKLLVSSCYVEDGERPKLS